MNRLWVRLSLYFGALTLAGMVLMILLARLLVSERANQFFLPAQLRSSGGVVEGLASYYSDHGNWDGVGEYMRGVRATTPLWSNRLDLVLADAEGNLVYAQRRGGGPLGRASISVPVEVDGRRVGELQVRTLPAGPQRGPPLQGLSQQVSRWLFFLALAGGVVGVAFSIVASRTLTAPLSRLAAAARTIGARNFSHRVEPTGSSEVIEVAEAFNEMARRLEETETLRRNLVADVAHELRTPLSVLQGNLRALLDDLYPLNKAEITRLYTQTRLLSRLVGDLHELAQAEAGQLSLNRQPSDLAQLMRETVEAYEPVAEEAGVTLQVDLATDLPRLPIDPARLSQVFHNLIANALRHTPSGGVITLRAHATRGEVILAVADNGEGIAREHIAHVFERFYRTDRARARDTGGAGLGLAIVRAIVQAHGGKVAVESEGVGKGSTFIVRLPINPVP